MLQKLLAVSVLAAIASAIFPSCGGDSGNDEEFVTDLCVAATDLRTGLEKAVKDAASSTEPNKAVEIIAVPIDVFVKSFSEADPPGDLKDWHDAASNELKRKAQELHDSKSLSSLKGFEDSPVPDPPTAQKQRLRDAAADIRECNGVVFLKPN